MSAKFKPGDRVTIWTPDMPQFHRRTGTVKPDGQFPAAEDGYDVWVALDRRSDRWQSGAYGFTFDELRPIGGQR